MTKFVTAVNNTTFPFLKRVGSTRVRDGEIKSETTNKREMEKISSEMDHINVHSPYQAHENLSSVYKFSCHCNPIALHHSHTPDSKWITFLYAFSLCSSTFAVTSFISPAMYTLKNPGDIRDPRLNPSDTEYQSPSSLIYFHVSYIIIIESFIQYYNQSYLYTIHLQYIP